MTSFKNSGRIGRAGRVLEFPEIQHLHVEIEPVEKVERAFQSFEPSRIIIEAHEHGIREAPELFEMIGRKSRARNRRDVFYSGLPSAQKIHLSFHQNGCSAVGDGFLGSVEAIERPRFVENGSFGRIEVFGRWSRRIFIPRLRFRQYPAREGDGLTHLVRNWKNYPLEKFIAVKAVGIL